MALHVVQITVSKGLLLIGPPLGFDPVMLNASDSLVTGSVIRLLVDDSLTMAVVRKSWRQLVPAQSGSALDDNAIRKLLERELGAGRLKAVLLREPATDLSPVELAGVLSPIVNCAMPGMTLLIAPKGVIPATFDKFANNAAAAKALSLIAKDLEQLRRLERQSGKLGAGAGFALTGSELIRHLTEGLQRGSLSGAVLTGATAIGMAAARRDVPPAISDMGPGQKIAEAMQRAIGLLEGALKDEFKALLDPVNLGIMAAAFLAIAAAQATPASIAINSVLVFVAWTIARLEGVRAIVHLVNATRLAIAAELEVDIDRAADAYKAAFVAIGSAILALFAKRLQVKKGGTQGAGPDFQAKLGGQGKPDTSKPIKRSETKVPVKAPVKTPPTPKILKSTNPRPAYIPSRTKPTLSKATSPQGQKTTKPANADRYTKRGLDRENESAKALAAKGFKVEQNPNINTAKLKDLGLMPGKRPDYLVEGKVFDSYAPTSDSVGGVMSGITSKVNDGQTRRIVVNLTDSKVTPGEVQRALRANPVDELQEIITIGKDGIIHHTFP